MGYGTSRFHFLITFEGLPPPEMALRTKKESQGDAVDLPKDSQVLSPGEPKIDPGSAEVEPPAPSLQAHQAEGDSPAASTMRGQTRKMESSLSPFDEVDDSPALGPTASLPGNCAFPPTQEKRQKIAGKKLQFFLVILVCLRSAPLPFCLRGLRKNSCCFSC